LALNPHDHSHQTTQQRISALGLKEPAQSVTNPLTVELLNALNRHPAAEVLVLEVQRHV